MNGQPKTNAEILAVLLGVDEWRPVDGDVNRRALALNTDQILVQFDGPYATVTFTDPYDGQAEVTMKLYGWSFGTLAALLTNLTVVTNIAKINRQPAEGGEL